MTQGRSEKREGGRSELGGKPHSEMSTGEPKDGGERHLPPIGEVYERPDYKWYIHFESLSRALYTHFSPVTARRLA